MIYQDCCHFYWTTCKINLFVKTNLPVDLQLYAEKIIEIVLLKKVGALTKLDVLKKPCSWVIPASTPCNPMPIIYGHAVTLFPSPCSQATPGRVSPSVHAKRDGSIAIMGVRLGLVTRALRVQ